MSAMVNPEELCPAALTAQRHRWTGSRLGVLLGALAAQFACDFAEEQLIELGDAYRGTALVLGDVVEADDTYTGEHCKGVVALALQVADELGLDARQRRNVEFGALLHDVGKIAVPTTRSYRAAKPDDAAIAELERHAGTQFDPRVVEALARVVSAAAAC